MKIGRLSRAGSGNRLMQTAFVALAIAALSMTAPAKTDDSGTAVLLLNPTSSEALVRLLGRTNSVVRIPGGEKKQVAVEPGDYTALVRYGTDPDRFTYSQSRSFHIGFATAPPQATVTLPPVRPLPETSLGDTPVPEDSPTDAASSETASSETAVYETEPSETDVSETEMSETPSTEPATEESAPAKAPPALAAAVTASASAAAETPTDTPVLLSGRIMNLQAAAPLIDKSSYLQLTKLPPDNQLLYRVDRLGRIHYVSDLPAAELTLDGTFRLELPEMQPGRYVMVGQSLDPASAEYGNVPILTDAKTGRARIISVPQGRTAPLDLDLGPLNVSLPTPQ